MPSVRLILALHDHQPVGNFDGVFEGAYRDSYLPFLEVMEDYPDLPFVLHTSGPLLEWLVERKPEYVARVKALVESGRVEILGGGFFEPILTMIPHRDRVGQIRDFSDYLQGVFGTRPRGIWLAERVWEQHLTSALVEAGVEYTTLDDSNFARTGVPERDLRGYFLTEEDGRLLKVFPISEPLRYMIPFREPHATYEYLKAIADEHPGSVLVFADDGEKFGSWPETYQHVYRDGWLRRFCDMIVANLDWLRPTTFAEAVDSTLPRGKVYLPDSSYREMTEWVLPADRLVEYQAIAREALEHPTASRLKPFVRAGGFWRNFKAKYAETDEMYSRMLGISNRLDELARSDEADPDFLAIARQELYRGQCNCPYWHGAFGGLYLPHLRNAVYRHLINAHNALDEAEGLAGPRVSIEAADYNLDARQEVRLENDQLVAFIRPAQGGHVYELDVRHASTNLLATLDRRPEAYHAIIAAAAASREGHRPYDGPPSILNKVVLKQEGLDDLLVYDRLPRKALVDHFLPLEATVEDMKRGRVAELGDFANGTYLSRLVRSDGTVSVIMERPGMADGHPIVIRKTIAMEAGIGVLDVHYAIEELPTGVTLGFAVELNVAAMAGHADDRYYSDGEMTRFGKLDSTLQISMASRIVLTDEWLDLAVNFEWSTPADVWCFPIETVSQSEGGYEAVYQSSAVVPRWRISADESRRWEVRIRWSIGTASGEASSAPREWTTAEGGGLIAAVGPLDIPPDLRATPLPMPFPSFWPFRRRKPEAAAPRVDAASIIRKARKLRFRVRRGAVADLSGAYVGARPGTGLAFAELRPYEPGDDVRHIDWNVTARQGRPFVRRFAEERALTVWLIVDISASLRFGPDGKTKADRAVQSAALLATAAIQAGDRAGLALVSDRVEAELLPAAGARQLARLVRALVATPSRSKRTALAVGLRGLARSRRRALVVVLSDFLTVEPALAWKSIARRHDVIAIRLVDPREEDLPSTGMVDLVDAESGTRRTVDLGSRKVRKAYARRAEERARDFRRWCASSGVGGLDVSTVDEPIAPLIRFFTGRAARRGARR